MFLSLKTLYRKRTVIWPFYFYTIIRTLSRKSIKIFLFKTLTILIKTISIQINQSINDCNEEKSNLNA